MKAKLRLRIRTMVRENECVSPGAVMVAIVASGDGDVVAEVEEEARAEITLRVRPGVADLLQFGQPLFVTVSTEEEP